MDLVQAEAVRDIIEASTLYQAQVASRQQSGQLSRLLDTGEETPDRHDRAARIGG